jgi:hypothetical protein
MRLPMDAVTWRPVMHTAAPILSDVAVTPAMQDSATTVLNQRAVLNLTKEEPATRSRIFLPGPLLLSTCLRSPGPFTS